MLTHWEFVEKVRSSVPPNQDTLEDVISRLQELPPVPRVLELLASARSTRELVRLGVLSAVEETSLAVDLDLATMRLSRELDDIVDSR